MHQPLQLGAQPAQPGSGSAHERAWAYPLPPDAACLPAPGLPACRLVMTDGTA